jgi:integration host factor subunit alpha
MVKEDIVEQVFLNVGLPKRESADLVEMAFEIIKESLERGENVKISGFGTFVVRQKRARRGRNPHTGEELEISARRVLSFKPSEVLRKAINGGDNSFRGLFSLRPPHYASCLLTSELPMLLLGAGRLLIEKVGFEREGSHGSHQRNLRRLGRELNASL